MSLQQIQPALAEKQSEIRPAQLTDVKVICGCVPNDVGHHGCQSYCGYVSDESIPDWS